MEIVVDAKKPFLNIVKFNVSKINFLGYAECFKDRMRELQKTDNEILAEKAFRRSRRLKQIKAFDKDGNIIAMDHEKFARMPRPLFIQLNNALDSEKDERGKIISENGDGLYTPILYELGTPLAFTDTKLAEKPIGTESKIVELEFIAKTGGDIEEVLCGDTSLDQVIALIKTCATPIGGETSVQRLPSWLMDKITLQDGYEIMSKVLPVFVE